MIIIKKAISRRTVLRGIGTTLALPLLDAMVPAFAATMAKPRIRLGYVYVPVGRIMDKWTPAAVGSSFEMTPTLEPLTPFRDQLQVLSGLNIKAADPWPGERGGTHARPSAAYLTGVHPQPNQSLGVSVDQVVARQTGKHTQLASLELGLDPAEFAGGNEADYSGYYRSTLAWRSPTTPLPMEHKPRAVFERLFGDGDSTDPAARLGRIRRQRSILDFVAQDVTRVLKGLDAGDRSKLSEFLDAIRDVEKSIQKAEQQGSVKLPELERPTSIPPFEEHVKLMFDLQVLAYQTDLTRVVTFMMSREFSELVYSNLGHTDPHHPLTHHRGRPRWMKQAGEVNVYHASLLAYFLERMRSTPDGDGSLLDHIMLLYGSGMGDSNLHAPRDLPILLAGGAAGQIKGGRHIRCPEGTPLSNLYLTMLNKLGVPAESIGDSTGQMHQLSDV